MLNITLSWAQLGTGMGFPILACPGKSVPHLECEFLQSFCTGLTTIEARIECYNSFIYKPRCIDDSHIMDAICESPAFTKPNIRRINACRLYLQITLILDLAMPCGKHFDVKRKRNSINKIICHNEGLLIRIEEASEWEYLTPNVTLRAEWDIESVFLEQHHKMDFQFIFKHVKSQQDDDADLASLTLESQLNVKADKLATAFMVEDKTRRQTATLFPSARAQLIIKDVSVTRKIPQAIRFATGSQEIRKYLMNCNTWSKQTLDDINWEAHGSSHSSLRPHKCFLVRICHCHLPLGKRLHHRDSKYPSQCPGCCSIPKSQQHFLQCAAPSHIEWRIHLLTVLRAQMKVFKTKTNLQEAIVNCIDSTLSGRDTNTTGTFSQTLKAQACIGWQAMLCGYWTKEWQRAYERSYPVLEGETKKIKNKWHRDMARWQKKVIQCTWTSMIQLWKLRIKERCGWDKETRNNARQEVLHTELADLYNRKHKYPLQVQRLLRASYEVHITEMVTKMTDWLGTYKGTFAVTWSPD
jgi:hypothetical protein